MSKYVIFKHDANTLRYSAEFYNGERLFTKKWLTVTEEENLEEYLDDLEDKVSMEELFEARDSGVWQDEDNDTTNFELVLEDLQKEEED
jgi:hypothetical protein